jgi:anti-sigma-K factor RskA
MAAMTERMQDFERRTRQAFEESVASLDGQTRSRLSQARELALAEARRGYRPSLSTWVPVGAAAAAAVVAIALWSGGETRPDSTEPTLAVLEEFDIVTAGDDLEMLDEDPDFYAWATEEQSDGVG